MKKVLSPSTIAIVGILLFGIGFITMGVLPDLLRIFGIALILIGTIGIFQKNALPVVSYEIAHLQLSPNS